METKPKNEYVRVNIDGSVRELTASEASYLSQDFHPNDGARPYIKDYYEELTLDGRIDGFLLRILVPPHTKISESVI